MRRCFFLIIFTLIIGLLSAIQVLYAQKLLEKQLQDSINQLPSNKQKIAAYLHYAQEFGFDNILLSKKLAEKALILAKKNYDTEGEIRANLILSFVHNYTQPLKAFLFFNQAQKLAKTSENYPLLVEVLEQQALYHIRWLQYEEASRCIGEAIRIIKQKKLDTEPPYQTLALILAKQGKPQEAILYYQKVISQKKKEKEVPEILNDLGNVYYNIGQYDSARVYYFKGLKIAQKNQTKRDLGYLFDNIGLSLYAQKRYKEAIPWQRQGLDCRREAHSTLDIIANLNNLGKTYLELARYDSAYALAKESYAKSLHFRDVSFLREVTELLANVYLGKGNLDSAFIYQKYTYQYLDTLKQQQQLQAVQGASIRIEIAKQVFENELLKTKNEELYLIGIILGVFLLGITVLSLVIFRQSKHRQHLVNQLQEANNTKERLFAIIGHDLRSPIASLNSLLDLVNTHDISSEEFLKISGILKTNVEHVHFTLNNLLQWANTQMNGIYTQAKGIKLYWIAEENRGLLQRFAQNKQIRLSNEIEENIEVWADYEQVSLIFRNLISNAIKFTPIGGQITITAILQDTYCKICISDNGMGMSKDLLSQLFQNQYLSSRRGTMGENGTGLGLRLCKEFVEKNGGTIWTESEEGIGTRFYFTLMLPSEKI